LAGVWSLGVGFVIVKNLDSVIVKMFSYLIFLRNYKFCTCNAICKNNAAINCIAVFPSTLKGHTLCWLQNNMPVPTQTD
jgi:hypothetical protein